MSVKKAKTFAIIISAAFVIAAVFFVTSIISLSNKGSSKASASFDSISTQINQSAETNQILSASYLQEVKDIVSKADLLDAITLTKDSLVFFAWPADSHLLSVDVNSNMVISTSSPMIKIFTKTINTGNSGTLTISCAMQTLFKKDIFSKAAVSFLIVLAGTIVSLVLLIVQTFQSKHNSPVDAKVEETADELETESDSFPDDSSEDDFAEDESDAVEDSEEIAEENPEILEDESTEEHTVEEETLVSEEKHETESIEEQEEEESFEPVLSESEDPMGLFSPKTGFGWESYLETRLDAELVRAASNEQDIALFMLVVKEIDRHPKALRALCDLILSFFQYRDLVFEYGKDGFTGIAVNLNINQAMIASEQLYARIQALLKDYNLDLTVGIGISTRSLRLLPGSRLLAEAKEAVEKAVEETEIPIVAFRVNHEKYRQYLQEATESISMPENVD